jgi:hypothetical protein
MTMTIKPPPAAMPAPFRPSMPAPAAMRSRVSFGKIGKALGQRIVLYGPGGIGKTTLAATAPGPVAFVDLDGSLPTLASCVDMPNVKPVGGVDSWDALRQALQAPGWDAIKTIVLDTTTRAEELCVAHTLKSVKTEKGTTPDSIEGYGYGYGYQFVFDQFLPLLGDLDRHTQAGRHVILICHDCTAGAPNPAGEDCLRYEPRLQNPSSGRASIRLRVREWADHLLCYTYDIAVGKDGARPGVGARTIYPVERPFCMAKSRLLRDEIPVVEGENFWGKLIQ